MTDALLLMDIQNGVVGRFGAGDDYLDRVVAAQATAEAVGIPVILVRVGFYPGYRLRVCPPPGDGCLSKTNSHYGFSHKSRCRSCANSSRRRPLLP
jgi:nicotinamidase-related amidase